MVPPHLNIIAPCTADGPCASPPPLPSPVPLPLLPCVQLLGPMVNLRVLLSAYPYVLDIPQGLERLIDSYNRGDLPYNGRAV